MSSFHALKGGSWEQRRVSPISMILIMASIITLSSCGFRDGSSDNSSSTILKADNQLPTNALKGILSQIHMIDTTVGWGVNWDIMGSGTYNILKTIDGGRQWKVMLSCTSSQGLGKGFVAPCYTDFHSASVATVLAPEYDAKTQVSQSRIFHTSDGGQTWQSSVIHARSLETPATFVDGLHGWFFATDHFPGYDPGSAYIGKEIALYRTSDGGKSWQRVGSGPGTSQISVTSDDSYGIAPFAASARMNFVTPTQGWLAGTSSHQDNTDFCWLYGTHNGGTTWQQVHIAFPAQALLLWTPTFFTEQEGLLPVMTSGPAPQYTRGTVIYVTHDGGQTWANGATVPFDVTNATFFDMQHAWAQATDGSVDTFYTTSDGWHSWTKRRINVNFQRVHNFYFVSPSVGWAITDNRKMFHPEPGGGLSKGDLIYLLKTIDGGQTWQVIARSQV